jgi:hypothetical protein
MGATFPLAATWIVPATYRFGPQVYWGCTAFACVIVFIVVFLVGFWAWRKINDRYPAPKL